MQQKFCVGCGEALESSWRYCSKCGEPTGSKGGAPAPSSSKPVWIIVAVAILFLAIPLTGIIAAIAIPNFLHATQRAKQKRTMADIRMMGTAIEAYAVDHNAYPAEGSSLEDIETLISPTYIRELPRTDGWSQQIRYHCLESDNERCVRYAIQSAGKDGFFDDLPYRYDGEGTSNFDCDILYSNGTFVWYPEGIQGGR